MPIVKTFVSTWDCQEVELFASMNISQSASIYDFSETYTRFTDMLGEFLDGEDLSVKMAAIDPSMRHHDFYHIGLYFAPRGTEYSRINHALSLKGLTDYRWLLENYGVSWDLVIGLPLKDSESTMENVYRIGSQENQESRIYIDVDTDTYLQIVECGQARVSTMRIHHGSPPQTRLTIPVNRDTEEIFTKLDLLGLPYLKGKDIRYDTVVNSCPAFAGVYGKQISPGDIPWGTFAYIRETSRFVDV